MTVVHDDVSCQWAVGLRVVTAALAASFESQLLYTSTRANRQAGLPLLTCQVGLAHAQETTQRFAGLIIMFAGPAVVNSPHGTHNLMIHTALQAFETLSLLEGTSNCTALAIESGTRLRSEDKANLDYYFDKARPEPSAMQGCQQAKLAASAYYTACRGLGHVLHPWCGSQPHGFSVPCQPPTVSPWRG